MMVEIQENGKRGRDRNELLWKMLIALLHWDLIKTAELFFYVGITGHASLIYKEN